MENFDKIKEFVKRHVYFILGGACLLVVGAVYLTQTAPPSVNVNENFVAYIPSGERAANQEQEPSPETMPEQIPIAIPEPEPETVPSEIIVHVVGAVKSPGVYVLEEGSRVYDALYLAGGAADDADLRQINLAALLQDAMQIIVPYDGEEVAQVFVFAGGSAPAQTVPGQSASGLVNINLASSAELQTLPGIGPVLADAIIGFRETHGMFRTVEELINVPRIGPATLERLRSLVEVG